ncbi:MAG: BON domain-containing protein [Chromatiaceae bacterium]|nr:BON domain-containing protein [Chromatiaceae bacterium]
MHSWSHSNRRLNHAGALAALLIAASLLQGCGPLVVGSVAAGAATLYDRRPYYVVIDDQQIELAAMNALLQDPGIANQAHISVTSYNRTVLLAGRADSPEVAERATRRLSELPRVARVVDEIVIGPRLGLARKSEDAYLSSRAKLALGEVDLPDFNATRVKIVTENGVVYLMGLVTPEEATAAAEKVRYVPGVKRVVKLFEYIHGNR